MDQNFSFNQLEACASEIRTITDFVPEYAVMLNRGLYDFTEKMDIACTIPYSDLASYPQVNGQPQKGKFVFGTYAGKKILLMMGRNRAKEGNGHGIIAFPIRLFKALGVKNLVITNAVGSMSDAIPVGSFALVKDHISFYILPPFTGVQFDDSEIVTPDMTNVYSREMNRKVIDEASAKGIPVHEAILGQAPGPHYETVAEINAMKLMGCDIVAQSGVIEGICAKYIGLNTCILSSISNMAAGMSDVEVNLKNIVSEVNSSIESFKVLFEAIFK